MPTIRKTSKNNSKQPAVKVKVKVRRSSSSKPVPLSVPVYGIDGKSAGTVSLPGQAFAAKVNDILVAQAVRVYLANQREGSANTKTRGEVEGSTRKIYRQKGTGRARHGAVRAPIFVGGGVVFGPQARDYHRQLPSNMKRAALASALTSAKLGGKVRVVDGLGELDKTHAMASAMRANCIKGSVLLVVGSYATSAIRFARNIRDVDILSAQDIHAYAVLSHQTVLFMKEAVDVLGERFKKPKRV